MGNPTPLTTSPGSIRNWNDDTPRVKILCSFSGSILPRPQDGKLRYVGGETRILSVPRDITFEELMTRMKELYEGATVLKYKQPDEDLDALVSVVNDDDVTNMMEEYDKLGSGDGFTRLRVFLFSNSELDDPLHFLDTDGRDSERRYVDALNSLHESPEYGKQQMSDFQGMSPIDDPQLTEYSFNQLNLDGGIHNPRNYDTHMPPINLHQLTIPHLGSLHHQQQPLSPAYYSPRHPESSFPTSPSCSYYHAPYEPPDRVFDRVPSEDYYRQHHNDPRTFYNGPTGYPDSHHIPSPYVPRDDRTHYIRHRHEYGNELFHDQMTRYGNYQYGYGQDSSSNGHVQNSFYVQSPMHGSPSNETTPISPNQENGMIPRLRIEVENPNPLVDPAHKLTRYNENDVVPDYYPVRPLKLIPNSYNVEDSQTAPEPVPSNDSVLGFDHVDRKSLSLNTMNRTAIQNENDTEPLIKIDGNDDSESKELNSEPQKSISFMDSKTAPEKREVKGDDDLSYVPQFIESVKKAVALEVAEEVKSEVQEAVDPVIEKVAEDAPEDLELDSDTGTESNSKIEQTKAEEDAIARGLQTIKNDDLEEIRQLGSGTYGAVYHGKWKGSDVAIKRIKASCFAGKPSERERMIADFWKEASMLSSLHHPNVVSFYGIVRDGPDGSLATVTEYMINGSLKQFLKKKDRTIDRRKRLIIAMDTAFGMEYLHGKNIVHFDLKCENLLVNMRDPHRPICKIGDLGLSKVKQQTMVSGGVRGTLPWMAPELLSGKSQMVTEKIDVYSFGVVMWELLTGDEPYTNMHCASIIGGIVNNTLRPTIPTWCDPEWKSLMESCWSADPQERPSFLEISQKLRTMAAAMNVK
ncbi:hypothetical protein L2E82_12226 [Cichorium intybus]|uniref:Uncharacterized protein n=1 Tax=Cichorium intybus TaxID=13427 RepID=A0ACB9GGJ9_CICIN|nr:hypothetical protein L2E82_12226 [Cichorium intybus]